MKSIPSLQEAQILKYIQELKIIGNLMRSDKILSFSISWDLIQGFYKPCTASGVKKRLRIDQETINT